MTYPVYKCSKTLHLLYTLLPNNKTVKNYKYNILSIMFAQKAFIHKCFLNKIDTIGKYKFESYKYRIWKENINGTN